MIQKCITDVNIWMFSLKYAIEITILEAINDKTSSFIIKINLEETKFSLAISVTS